MKAFKSLIVVSCLLLVAPVSCAKDAQSLARENMVEKDLKGRGIKDERVLKAMGKIPRERFVPALYRSSAYADSPLPIGEGQTISQPYVVAVMTEALELKPTDRVLEIGTGSGYQAAVLAEIAGEVYTIEIQKKLAERSAALLKELGYTNVEVRYGDGYKGWPERVPFDAIIITAAVDQIPPPLLQQLRDGGRLIVPLGSPSNYQVLTLVSREGEELKVEHLGEVRFVPMTGEAEK